MLIDGYIINVDFLEIKAHTAQLEKISANVNQIVKRVNMTGNFYGEDIAEIKSHIDEVWKMELKLMYSIMHYAK